VNLLLGAVFGAAAMANRTDSLFSSDYRDTNKYKNNLKDQFIEIMDSLPKQNDTLIQEYYLQNTLYFGSYAPGNQDGKSNVRTNYTAASYEELLSYLRSKPDEYGYILNWDGKNLSISKDKKEITAGEDEVYSEIARICSKNNFPDSEKYSVVIGVKSKLSAKSGGIYNAYLEWIMVKAAAVGVVAAFLISVILLIVSVKRKESRKEFSKRLANYSGKFWIEIKFIISVFFIAALSEVNGADIIIGVVLIWWAYLMFIDIYTNRKRFFSNNSVNWLIKFYRKYENRKSFQKAMILRFAALTAAEAVLIFFTFISMAGGSGVPFALVFIALGVYLFYRFMKAYEAWVTDIGSIVEHIELIRNGDLNTRLKLKEDSDMYFAAENLNHIQEGVHLAAQEQLRSEKMKIELITNVSHDLKTPLTSIVNYIDLLAKEELLPEFANDYVKILGKKAARLTSLTQDLFDISKAQSGNMELNIERLNIVELLKQSIAELDEKIKESGLNFRVNLPQEKVYISADGRKLYRVFDNLVSNILKYSLANTRVYINLIEDNENVIVEFKNIASYEMNIDPKEITERFVRGDESRTTEGSGLGLAIVQSFVSLCGGQFEVKIDGDLFKAIVSFKKADI
jgi:signal transduction histidine kinase